MTRKQVVHFTGSGPAWPASYIGFYSDSGATTPVTVYSNQIASTVLASGKAGSSPVRKLRADGNGTVPPVALGIGLYVDSAVTTLYARPETVTGVAVSGAAAVSVASYGPDGPVDPVTPGGVSTSDLNAAVAAAVTGLVNGAPGALDTLGELAAALTADESAAATLTTLVGTKAPLASPAFTGTPTAPTAAGGTSTTQVATTAFVAAAVTGGTGSGLPSNILSKTANYTAAAGDFVEGNVSGGGFTVTLPTTPAVGALVAVKKVDSSGNTLTIAPHGAGTIDGQATATTATQYAGAVFEHIGSDVWLVVASMTTTGPQGPTGATGATGATGTTGATGATGPAWTRPVLTVTQSATPAINTDNCINGIASISALAQAITSMTTSLTGTPVDGQSLIVRITDNGTARAISWGASFEASTVALPTTTVISTRLTVGFLWNTVTSKWRCIAVA